MSAMHYLKTKRRPTETVHFAEAQTGYGTVDLESHDEEGLRAVLRAIDEYETILDQRDAMAEALKAHAEWKRHTERCTACILDLSCPAYSALERKADGLTRDALALVRGEGEQ